MNKMLSSVLLLMLILAAPIMAHTSGEIDVFAAYTGEIAQDTVIAVDGTEPNDEDKFYLDAPRSIMTPGAVNVNSTGDIELPNYISVAIHREIPHEIGWQSPTL